MINKSNIIVTVPYILSNSAQKAYEKIKALILKIFLLLKKEKKQESLKEEFYDSYIDFAKKLDKDGHHKESNNYIAICDMYYDLMDRPDALIAHENFFNDLFDAFDELLNIKINDDKRYDEEYEKFISYRGAMQEYYYTTLAIPSKNYNKKTCKEIIGHLAGGIDDE